MLLPSGNCFDFIIKLFRVFFFTKLRRLIYERDYMRIIGTTVYQTVCTRGFVLEPAVQIRLIAVLIVYPCTTRRLKAVKASHVWAAGGARTQARRSTGDVVGGLPTEKSRGLRRDPAQGQRTEVGRIRSCCQGWTGLDDCCEEHGQVAPGGREGSGSTRQRLATRGPSSIQRATPALG